MSNQIKKNILIGCTGSVATLKLPIIIQKLEEKCEQNNIKVEIKIIVTENAKHFFDINDIPKHVKLYDDKIEWASWEKRGDPVLHIDLGKWADLFLIAPLDANCLAKMAQGICDNFLLCTTRAWNLQKPLLFCPAMNTRMYEHPITAEQIGTLEKWGHTNIQCISKTLICGDLGLGAMANVDTIIDAVYEKISNDA